MADRVKKVLSWIWPPYGAHLAQVYIDAELAVGPEERWALIQGKIRSSLPSKKAQPQEMETLAGMVFDSENKRKDTLEGKALGFVSSLGIAISIVSALPILFGETRQFSSGAALILGILFLFGIIHLVTAVYWSVQARIVEGLAVLSADETIAALMRPNWGRRDRIAIYLAKAKFNEPLLTKKANCVAVAESMFLRGLLFIALAATVNGAARLLTKPAPVAVGCKIPEVVGLDRFAAEQSLLSLGLSPITSNQYDANIEGGVVIRQDPIQDSFIRPCDAGVTIVVSLGPIPTPLPLPTPP